MYLNQNERYYNYEFSNGERHTMTPVEAHQYSFRKKIEITNGPGYRKEEKEKSFDGWGWHSGLLMNFRGPNHYRSYLKEHGMVEAGFNDRPTEQKFRKPVWDEKLIKKAFDLGVLNSTDGRLIEALLNGELDWPDGSMEETEECN